MVGAHASDGASSMPPPMPLTPMGSLGRTLSTLPEPTPHGPRPNMAFMSQILQVAAALQPEDGPMSGDSWMESPQMDLISLQLAHAYPSVHFMPCEFLAYELPRVARAGELDGYCPCDILGRPLKLNALASVPSAPVDIPEPIAASLAHVFVRSEPAGSDTKWQPVLSTPEFEPSMTESAGACMFGPGPAAPAPVAVSAPALPAATPASTVGNAAILAAARRLVMAGKRAGHGKEPARHSLGRAAGMKRSARDTMPDEHMPGPCGIRVRLMRRAAPPKSRKQPSRYLVRHVLGPGESPPPLRHELAALKASGGVGSGGGAGTVSTFASHRKYTLRKKPLAMQVFAFYNVGDNHWNLIQLTLGRGEEQVLLYEPFGRVRRSGKRTARAASLLSEASVDSVSMRNLPHVLLDWLNTNLPLDAHGLLTVEERAAAAARQAYSDLRSGRDAHSSTDAPPLLASTRQSQRQPRASKPDGASSGVSWQQLAQSAITGQHQETGFDCGIACLLYAEQAAAGVHAVDINLWTDQADFTAHRLVVSQFLQRCVAQA